MNPRAKIHELWEAFWPSIVFAAIYFWVLTRFIGISPVAGVSAALDDVTNALSQSAVTAKLKELELLKLLPVAALFAVALALYLFDRVVTLIGNVLPPRLFWRGDLLLHLGEQRLTHLWFTCPKIADVSGLSREVNRLVERAFAENRSRLTSGLEWPQKKFSDAARTVNYCKVLVYWIVACAIYALAYLPHKNETARRLFVLMGSGLLAYVGAVLLETHRLFDVDQERLRIAETMIEIEGGQYEYSEERRLKLSEQYRRASQHVSRPVIRLGWGSTEGIRRLVSALWWRRTA